MKKTILTLGAITTAVAPMVAVISCGEETSSKGKAGKKSIIAADQSKVVVSGTTATIMLKVDEYPTSIDTLMVRQIMSFARAIPNKEKIKNIVVMARKSDTEQKFYKIHVPVGHIDNLEAMVSVAQAATISDTHPLAARQVNAKQNEVAEIKVENLVKSTMHTFVKQHVDVSDFDSFIVKGKKYYGESLSFEFEKKNDEEGLIVNEGSPAMGTKIAIGDKLRLFTTPSQDAKEQYSRFFVEFISQTEGRFVQEIKLDNLDDWKNIFEKMDPIPEKVEVKEWDLDTKDVETATYLVESAFDQFYSDVMLKREVHANKDYGFDLPDGTTLHGRALTFKSKENYATSGVVVPQASTVNGQQSTTTTLGNSIAIDDELTFITVPDTRWNILNNQIFIEFKPKNGQPIVLEVKDQNLLDAITNLFIQVKVNKEQTPVPHKVDLTNAGMKEWHLLFYRDGERSLPMPGTILATTVNGVEYTIEWGATWHGGLESTGASERWPAEYVSNHVPDATPAVLLDWLIGKFEKKYPSLDYHDLAHAWNWANMLTAPEDKHNFNHQFAPGAH